MVDASQAFDSAELFSDDVDPDAAAGYILASSRELAGLARSMALLDVAAAPDRVAALAAEAQSRENAASDDAA